MQKMINSQGKLFGLINPIDLLAILLLLLLVLKLLTAWIAGPVSTQPCQITIALVARKVPSYLAQNIQVGQEISQDGSEYSLGTIQRKRVAPAETQVEQDGNSKIFSSPRNFDLRLQVGPVRSRIISGSGRSGIYLGKLPLRVGQRLSLHTVAASLTGEIEAVKQVRNGPK